VQSLGRKRRRTFTVNTYSSRGELETLQHIIKLNDWEEGTHPNDGHLIWFGLPLRENDIKLVNRRPDVYFNKYSGTEYLCRKKVLCSILSRMKRYFPLEYGYVPTEFSYPEQKNELKEYLKDNQSTWMIAKPSRGCGGEGIFLFKNKFNPPILKDEFVIQKYISKPLLVENKKFDLRLYVLIKNVDPLEAYFWNEGMVRLCTEDYVEPNEENIDQLFMHLTNFSLNKQSDNYINPLEYGEENKGTKRLLSQFFKQLVEEYGIDEDFVKDKMISTVRKTVVSLVPFLKSFARKCVRTDIGSIKWFQIIGIDIMLDADFNTWLMEINANPSMNMFLEKEGVNGDKEKILSELDKHLKTKVLQDAFHIVKSKDLDEFGCFEKILPVDDKQFNRYYLFDTIRDIFEKLGGVKKPDFLTASQFERLGRYPKLIWAHFGKADYAILFKECVRGLDSNNMVFDDFIKAIETVVLKMYLEGNSYENMDEYLGNINSVIH
jgi:hypothetical protein